MTTNTNCGPASGPLCNPGDTTHDLQSHSLPFRAFRRRTGAALLPPQAAAPARRARALGGYTPPQIAKRYAFPAGTGAGIKIAYLEFGGGFSASSLTPYWQQIGVAAPALFAHGVDGASNTPGSDADGEVCLDICVGAGIAPAAEHHVVFAPNSDQGFLDAHDYATGTLGVDLVSISWGGPENQWPAAAVSGLRSRTAAAMAKGVFTFVAAGDNDSGDGEQGVHVDFPGSCPEAFCCGGTVINPDGSESVWNSGQGEGTGGGYSALFQTPAWQAALNRNAARLVPDYAGVADPATGWYVSVNGQLGVIGGTSAVAPMYAGLWALLLAAGVRPTPAMIYVAGSTFMDIVSGNNGQYSATAGLDPCTGLGVPNGVKLLAALQGGTVTPPVKPPPVIPPKRPAHRSKPS